MGRYGRLSFGEGFLAGFPSPRRDFVREASRFADERIDSGLHEWDRSTWSPEHTPREIQRVWQAYAQGRYHLLEYAQASEEARATGRALIEEGDSMVADIKLRGGVLLDSGDVLMPRDPDKGRGGFDPVSLLRS